MLQHLEGHSNLIHILKFMEKGDGLIDAQKDE